jgi:hypothetical protein
MNQVVNSVHADLWSNDQFNLVEQLSKALQKLTTSASATLGSDCAVHAYLAHPVLVEHGIDCRVVIGAAAWRIGPNDGDVITHIPQHSQIAAATKNKAIPYHAWLENDSHIIDFSTHTLRLKAAQLDASDGGQTTVEWCPDYILISKTAVKPLHEVVQEPNHGHAYYQEIPGLVGFMKSIGFRDQANQEDLTTLRLVLANPAMHVMGINDVHLQGV